jgi:biotin carboxyl carrier protein
MSAPDDVLIGDARALLASFADSGAKTLTVQLRDDVTLALAREAVAAGAGRIVSAPHVATVLHLPAIGSNAAIRLDLLGDEISVELGEHEVIEDLMVAVGEMVEFGTPLARIEIS